MTEAETENPKERRPPPKPGRDRKGSVARQHLDSDLQALEL